MEKLNEFYADLLKKNGKLTKTQEDLLQKAFFPGWADDDPNKQLMDSLHDFTSAYTKWEVEQSKKPKPEKPLPPMSDKEVDDLAAML